MPRHDLFPKTCPFEWVNLQPLCDMWFLGLTRVLNPNGISIGSVVFAGFSTVTDRQRD